MENNKTGNIIPFDIDYENIKQNTLMSKMNNANRFTKQPEVIPNEEDPYEANKEQILYQCSNCSRRFKREAYAKHVPICARVFQNKKEQENPKNDVGFEKMEKNLEKEKNTKSKWENKSNELRAMIQNKRAEKGKNNINKEIKIEIEEPKKHIDNIRNGNSSPINNNRLNYNMDAKGFIQCDLCNKKFTKMNYENHLADCKQKYKDKNVKGIKVNKGSPFHNNNINNFNINAPLERKPIMPVVTYGINKPKFNLKFGK